jgi:hypothetical protein
MSQRCQFRSDPISFDHLIGPRIYLRPVCSEHCLQADCGPYFTSRIVIAGLVAKKLCGISVKPNQWVGITALVRVLRLRSR